MANLPDISGGDLSFPDPFGWKEAPLAPLETLSDLPPGLPAPDQRYRAQGPEGGALEALAWGRGTESRPLVVLVRFKAPPEEPTARFPTYEEVWWALHAVAPEGAFFLPEAMAVTDDPGRLSAILMDAGEWAGMIWRQGGIMRGSKADSGIIIPGRNHGITN